MPSMSVCPVPYHAVVPRRSEQEESSSTLEYHSSDSQPWPYPYSLGVYEAEVKIHDMRFPYSLPFGLCLCLCASLNHCLHPFLVGKCENHFQRRFLPIEKTSLPLLPLDHEAQFFCDHHSGSCPCSSPRNTLSFLLNPPLPFCLFLLFTW